MDKRKKSRCFGFLLVNGGANYEVALSSRLSIGGYALDIKKIVSREELSENGSVAKKIFFHEVASSMSRKEILESFEKLVKVQSLSMIKVKKTGAYRGIGFVLYFNKSSADYMVYNVKKLFINRIETLL